MNKNSVLSSQTYQKCSHLCTFAWVTLPPWKGKGWEEAWRTLEVLNVLICDRTYLVTSVVWPRVFTLTRWTYLTGLPRPLTAKPEWRRDHSAILKTNHSQQANELKHRGAVNLITFISSWSLRSFLELGSTMVRTSFSSKKKNKCTTPTYMLAQRLTKVGLSEPDGRN